MLLCRMLPVGIVLYCSQHSCVDAVKLFLHTFPCVLLGGGAWRNVGESIDVGGESESPPGMTNGDESGDPRIVHRKAEWKSWIQQYFSCVYDGIVSSEWSQPPQCSFAMLLFYSLSFLGDDRTPIKFCNFGCYCL